MKSITNWIKGVWKDPVWSKVISVGILAAIAWITSNVFPIVSDVLRYQVDLWLVLILIVVTVFVSQYYSSNRQKRVERDNKQKVSNAKNAFIRKENQRQSMACV